MFLGGLSRATILGETETTRLSSIGPYRLLKKLGEGGMGASQT
jgi:hypothetical protein